MPATSDDMPDCFVSFAGADAPTLIAIHGISRNAAEMATRFALHGGFAKVNIITPLFERSRFGKYQLMQTRKAQKTDSGTALFNLLRHFEAMGEIASGKVMLFGFSGGAQMAHRMAMFYPDRVSRLCAASAGWYLLPDLDLPYPYGLGKGCPVAVTDGHLKVPTTILVGTRDTRIDSSVRQDPVIVERQGRNRRQRAETWVRLMTERALASSQVPNVRLVTLENVSHDFGLCVREAALLDHAADALLS